MAELDKNNKKIREITIKIKEISDRQDELYGQDRRLTPEEMVWTKELRQLRRERDTNGN